MTKHRPFISLDDVTLRCGESRIFEHTTWRIHEKEQWVVVGDNGSGKSTLLGAFDGRTPVVGGEVWYHFACSNPDESYPDDGSIPESRIACVSQEDQAILARAGSTYHQTRWNASDAEAAPSVRECMQRRTSASLRAIRRYADRVGIAHRLNHPLPALSNGELRRVLLAEALLRNPRMLVLDDPYAGLDISARTQLGELIDELMAEGIQIVVIIRRPEELPRRATHVLHVAGGQVHCQGPIETLRHTRHLRSFLSLPKIARSPKRLRPPAPVDSSATEVFSVTNATVRYGQTVALRNVSWRVCMGERWALLGPNGSGKSTLIALITGDNLQAYANDVRLFGQRRGQGESIWDIRKRIGWVSPELQWHCPGDAPVAEIIGSGLFDTVGLQQTLTARQRTSVRAWLAQIALAGHEPFASLGAGQQRMALLARALIKSPALILLDEPCQGLDEGHRALFHRCLHSALSEHPCALVYITHHTDELPRAVNRVLQLNEGQVISGAPGAS